MINGWIQDFQLGGGADVRSGNFSAKMEGVGGIRLCDWQ